MKTVTRMEVAHVALTAVWAALLIGSAVLEHRYLLAALFAGLVWCVGYSGYLIGMWLVRRRIQHLPARLAISQETAERRQHGDAGRGCVPDRVLLFGDLQG